MTEEGGLGCSPSQYEDVATGKIWIDELTCLGIENNIDECQKNNWGQHNCMQKEDAGCICEGPLIRKPTVKNTGLCSFSIMAIFPRRQYPLGPYPPGVKTIKYWLKFKINKKIN